MNYAVATEGLAVIDCDSKEALQEFRIGYRPPPTFTVKTARGFHFYYRGEMPARNGARTKLDVKSGPGCYVVGPGSRHASGAVYAVWEDLPFADLPDNIGKITEQRDEPSSDNVEGGGIPVGMRNTTLTQFAGWLNARGVSRSSILEALKALNRTMSDKPLPDKEVRQIARSVSRYPSKELPRIIPFSEVAEEKLEWLWYPYVCLGTLGLLDGDPGDGKSQFCVWLCARVSQGQTLPNGDQIEPGIRIHTNWTNTVQQVHEIALEDLADAAKRDLLRACFEDPERLRPAKTRQMLTEEAAREFAALAQRLRDRGNEAHAVAHFVNRLVFCMFAEDVGLLPSAMFTRMLEASRTNPGQFADHARTLFGAMKSGGMVGFEKVEWFNGGLFDDDSALPLEVADIDNLLAAARLDWSEIDPSILGTLFERGLDPDKRSQLGAHYTDREKIMMIVRPVVIEPLALEWAEARGRIEGALAKAEGAKGAVRTKAQADAARIMAVWRERLLRFRVLDPACGSGNFLYLSLLALKDIEHRANLEAEQLGLPREFPRIGPENVLGIELNPYAAELARVSVWIGEIQWMRRNGFDASRNPILRTLGNIQQRDAIVEPDGTATIWPDAEAILGNPPYLGAKLLKRKLGVAETAAIRAVYEGRLPHFTDLVCYWFENAREMIEAGRAKRAGFVATNSIRKNTNLPVMHRIIGSTRVFEAWNEEKWTIDGAAVDVSLVCFGESERPSRLNGIVVEGINPDLTTGLNLTLAKALPENANGAFLGIQKSGPFDVPGILARQWLLEPSNPNGQPNSTILKPYWNGDDVTGRPRDYWLIDLPAGLSEAEASLFPSIFDHIRLTPDEDGRTISELRDLSGSDGCAWWELWRPRPAMRSSIGPLARYIVTPETAQHRIFVWLRLPTLPDKNLIVIPRDDDTFFGLLHSRFHELWSLRKGSDLQDRPRYTHTSTFATFPFPEGLTPNTPAADYADDPRAQAIAAAAARLNELRENWLNPPELIRSESEVLSVYPDRISPVDDAAAKELAKRTLTNLYNARPTWLDHAHRALDEAVANAYGWGDDYRAGLLTDDEILARLFRLNQERTGAG